MTAGAIAPSARSRKPQRPPLLSRNRNEKERQRTRVRRSAASTSTLALNRTG
jgi:hypothetical protein